MIDHTRRRRFDLLEFATGTVVTGATTFISLLVIAKRHNAVSVFGMLEILVTGFADLSRAMWQFISRFTGPFFNFNEYEATMLNASLLFAIPAFAELFNSIQYAKARFLSGFASVLMLFLGSFAVPVILRFVTGWTYAFFGFLLFPVLLYIFIIHRYVRWRDWTCLSYTIRNFFGAVILFIFFQFTGFVELIPA